MSNMADDRAEILAALEEAASGLTYMSESDFPLEPFVWTRAEVGADAMTPDALRAVTKQAADVPIEAVDFQAFFEPATREEEWYGEEEKAMAAGFRRLVETLETRLTDLTVSRVGEGPQKAVYVVGKTPAGDFAGVLTHVVET